MFIPRTEREYEAAVGAVDALVDEVGDNPKDPRYRQVETSSVLIESYDREHHALPEASGIEVVRFLMEQHRLTQSDLPEIGSQGVVSEVLRGKRELNVRQIKALAARFGVDPGAFLRRPRCWRRPPESAQKFKRLKIRSGTSLIAPMIGRQKPGT